MKFSQALLATLVLTLVLALAACGGTTSADPTSGNDGHGDDVENVDDTEADEDDAAEAGDDSTVPEQIVVSLGGEPEDGFDPTLGWGRYGSPLFHSTLLTLDQDLQIGNDLATEYNVSEDGLTWTVTLRDDATFTTGDPVTAADVAYTFNTAASSGGVVDLAYLTSAEATDDTHVTFALESPNSTFVNRLATLGIVPESVHDENYARNPVGSGPYMFERWDEGQQLVVTRNDDYYGDVPAFKQIVFRYLTEDGSLAAARAGEAALVSVPSTLATTEIDGMRLVPVDSVDNRGILFPMTPAGETTEDGQEKGNDITSDLAIRRAVNVVIDRQMLVDGILNGYGSPAYGPVDGLPWFEPDSVITDGDADAARRILEEGGWSDTDGDGIVDKDGVSASFTVIYPASDSVRQGLAVAVADMVNEIGIEINLDGKSWDDIETSMHSTPVVFGWGSHDPTEMYHLYHSDLGGVEYFNAGFYASDYVDGEFDAALAATDVETANEHWRAAQLNGEDGFTASADAAWAWLVNLDHTYYADECLDLGELQVEPHGHGYPITSGITHWAWTC